MFLLLTVPHGFCKKQERDRKCDLRALPVAKKIYDAFISNDKKIVYRKTQRQITDFNRRRNATTAFGLKEWDLFHSEIKRSLNGKETLLIDVHSFPLGSFNGSQIAILDIEGIIRPEVSDFVSFVNFETGIDIGLFAGSKNYIQNTYASDNCFPLLIEFCEDKNHLTDEDLQIFIQLLLDYFTYT